MTEIKGKVEYWVSQSGTSIVVVSRCPKGFGIIKQIGWLWV